MFNCCNIGYFLNRQGDLGFFKLHVMERFSKELAKCLLQQHSQNCGATDSVG